MSTSYWLSFRLQDSEAGKATYDQRLNALDDEIMKASGGGSNLWKSTTSFYIFRSTENIDALVARARRAIAEEVDLVVIGMNDIKGGRVVGNCTDPDIFKLVSEIESA